MTSNPSLDGELQRQAVEFAAELTDTVRAVVPGSANFSVVGVQDGNVTRLVVRQDPAEGILLAVDSVPMLRLLVSFNCVYDHRKAFLAVERSEMKVSAVASSTEPLFRYDYLREPNSGVPGAHLQVHAHRDAVTFVLTRCGDSSVRGKRRRRSADAGDRVPQLSDLHLPLGGARFRPCLEDVLQMLIDEFGVDAPQTAGTALAAGRASWRRKQLAAAVRDDAEGAATALESLGYTVTTPSDGHTPKRVERTHAI